jgi:ComF family protein
MEPPLDALIHALKYGNRPDLALPLGRLLASRVHLEGDGLVAVPLHRTRRRERGYNQAGLLAEAAGRVWGVPVIEGLLVRSRSTAAQARLRRSERSRNVGSAFRVAVPSWARGRSFVLLDDVGTSGSTLGAAAGPLLEAGAKRVVPVTLALA